MKIIDLGSQGLRVPAIGLVISAGGRSTVRPVTFRDRHTRHDFLQGEIDAAKSAAGGLGGG